MRRFAGDELVGAAEGAVALVEPEADVVAAGNVNEGGCGIMEPVCYCPRGVSFYDH